MKISGTKKLLLICFSLIIALTVSLFATHILSLNTYAEVSPDGLSAYADGESDIPGDDAIVDSKPFDPDHKEEEWTLTIQQVTLEFGKLVIRVDDWNENGLSTSPKFNANPDGIYDSRPDLVTKIEGMIKDSDFIKLKIYDVDGNEVTDTSNLPAGTTLFIHAIVNEKYVDSVSLIYKDGVPSSYAYTTDFPSSETLKKVDELTKTEYEFVYDGTELDFQKLVLDEVLKDRDTYLMFVASESDALKQNGAGEYHLRICFINGAKYCWKTEIPNDRHAVEIKIKVTPMILTVTADLGDKYYTGYDIDIAEELQKIYGEYVIVATGYSTVGKAVGDYPFNVLINPKYSASVKWTDGVEEPVTITWHIKQSVITGDWGPKGDFGKITITSDTYPGEQAGDIEYIYTDADGNVVTKLEVGTTYTVEAVLKNPNLAWSADPGTHTFTLTKELVELAKPVINVTQSEYTGTEISFVVTIDGLPLDDPKYADYVEIVADLSDSLTQTNVGKYKVVIRLKDGSASWTGNVSGDVVLEFEITKVAIDVQWNDADSGTPTFSSSLSSGDYSNVVKVTYKNSKGEEVTKAQMVKGETYTATVTLIDETNFGWKEGAVLEYTFTFNIDLVTLDPPTIPTNTFDFTGNSITVTVANQAQLDEYIANGYIEIVSGSFSQTNAGTHTIVLRIKNNTCIWADTEGEYITLTYTINKAVLTGEWQSDGKVKFSSSFLGNYDDVVVYEYTDSNGNKVEYSQLVEGETYTVSVKLKEGMDKNFDDSKLPAPTTITFKQAEEDKGGIPWWVWLIIGLAILIILIIILIIIIILKKRKKDDDYDDFYDDEYYGDEEGDGSEENSDGGYDDYGDYGDTY